MTSLLVSFTAGAGQRDFLLEVGGRSVTMGRSQEAELFVNSPRLSRRHCEVKLGDRGLELHDLASSNGTFLNGRRVDKALVRPGDVVQVGGIAIRIDYDASKQASTRTSGDLNCEKCGRPISMSTVEDGHVFELSDHILCPTCNESSRLSEISESERRIVELLLREGYTVEAKLDSLTGTLPVFRARRTGLDNMVAIKALPLVQGVSKKKVERFQQEAKSVAKIKHPNVIQVYDIRRLPELLYIVMEHVEGETLLQRIERTGKLPARDVLRMGLQIAKALEAAQKQGIVHRDIKPANILIANDDGSPKLVDFGLAKDLWQLTSGLTGPEETLGTVRYMPPEQVKNARAADHRADLYAVAATLFHALSGKPPYPDHTELSLMRHVIGGSLPPFDPRGTEGIPPAVAEVLARALQPEPEKRYPTAAEFRSALSNAVAQMAGIPGFKGDPELLLTLRQPLDQTWSGRVPAPPKPGGMAGAFEGDQLVEFVQMLGLNSKTGVLIVNSDAGSGHLALREGKIIAARARSGAKGDEAAYEVLSYKRGDFEFRPDLPATVKTEHNLPVQSLLLEALRRRDESSQSGGG